ncbi:family 43 glycosylhydrolase [Hymenobacter cheonanensis]|uniref:family 43 glycosylhydrolase n=1 Tax=Hymenobacter sp. CA2-7 TaxID=3063993 RepID=UPI002712BCA4|nr:family 43 glycosylhydrolase [Hymenobacter sp. CA2-7]MDO7886869.1 family 43 glycosylhydrolase [Hymenobacter sp. CA2-7]
MNVSTHFLARPLRAWASRLLWLALVVFSSHAAFALQGYPGAHDPSTMVKRNGVYHIWTTGDQVYHMTSTDLIHWQPAATVFAAGTWPGWVTTYVPGFKGNFWAPECVFMNGKYYLYYSCSLGGRESAIGLATSPDLTTWTDQGMVVYSDATSPWGSIDPAVFTDAQGKVWMAFGSHLSGNWLIQLDPTTGKRLDTNIKNVAGISPWCENEASYVMQHGGYYYLFYNRGICCAGVTSTYYVQMGRATSPTGPYLDKNGVDLLQGGGTDFLVGKDNYVGPGQVGLFTENGVNYLTYHYYNAKANGAPTLGIANLSWDAAGWPVATQDWLPAGTYTLTNQNSGKAWATASCTAAAGQALVQSTATGQPCQQWKLTPQGSGVYKITNVGSNLNADQADCAEAAGTKLGLQANSALNCQQFRVERAADGTYVLAAYYGNRVVEVPNAALTDGQQLGLWDYNGCTCQHWTISAVGVVTATAPAAPEAQIRLFPNPTPGGTFALELPAATAATVRVADLSGREVYRVELSAGGARTVATGLRAGAYLVQISTPSLTTTRKLVVL